MMDDLQNFIYRCVEKALAGRYHERHGLVTSYDPMNHVAKVMIQPEQFETGPLEIEVVHAGKGQGIMVGPVTGDGKKTGDQVIVRFHEGDIESGKIVKFVHDMTNTPPTIQSKEYLMQNHKQHHLFMDKDGNVRLAFNGASTQMNFQPQGQQPPPSSNIGTFKFDKMGNQTSDSNKQTQTVTDSNGATLVHDGQGNHSINAKKITHNSTAGDINHSAANQGGNANIIHTAQQNITDTATNGNHTRTASNGNITDTSPTINHNGNTNVTGTLGVSQLLSANGGLGFLGGLTGTGGGQITGLMKLLTGFQSSGGGSSMSGGATVTGGLGTDTMTSTSTVTSGGLLTAQAGAAVTGALTATSVATGTTVVGSLPAASNTAMRHFVTDSTVAAAGNFGAIVAGTGTNKVPVWSDGTNWRIG